MGHSPLVPCLLTESRVCVCIILQRVYPESPYQPSKSNQEILLWSICLTFDLFILQHKEIHHSLCPQAVGETQIPNTTQSTNLALCCNPMDTIQVTRKATRLLLRARVTSHCVCLIYTKAK